MAKKTLNRLEVGDEFRFKNVPNCVYRVVGFFYEGKRRMCRYTPVRGCIFNIESSVEVEV